MAASAFLSNTFSPYNSHPSSSRPKEYVSLQHSRNRFLINPGNPISRTVLSSVPISTSCSRNENSSFRERGDSKRRSFFKPSVSAHQDSQPYQTDNEDGSDSNEFQVPEHAANQKDFSRVKSLLQAYKEAIFEGDKKTVYEIEDMIFMVEKENSELSHKISSLSEEISSGKEKHVRLQADFDNYRKRSEKERTNVRSNAQGEVIESLLPMVDSFERAKQQIKLETEKEKKIDTSYQGIYKQFVEIMRSLKVNAVPTVGKPFDPSMHEAIAREESQEFKDGIIIQEIRRGFILGDRLLRPAMVKVSSGPGKKKTPLVPSEQSPTVVGIDNR